MSLEFVGRVRDVVHGFVYLTELESRVLAHPLMQRLRGIRQNDVASAVYPSLNSTRLEHSLGTMHVAGLMAVSATKGVHWESYREAVGLTADQWQQAVRLYALLHDLGHLPFSHLFEMAFDDFVGDRRLEQVTEEWTDQPGYRKLHESLGARFAKMVLADVGMDDSVASAVSAIMTKKRLDADDPRLPLKQLVDSEVDADRTDSTARDGRMAGGEYGNYDIERLASSVFVAPHEGGWRIVYSEKATSSIEGLLLDRYRTHTWIHFHHRVVLAKTAAAMLITSLLESGVITADDFRSDDAETMSMRDDAWLLDLLRRQKWVEESHIRAARVFFFRDKQSARVLWKRRGDWSRLQAALKARAGLRELNASVFAGDYESDVSAAVGASVRVFFLKFRPTERTVLPLTDERGQADRGDLLDGSALTEALGRVWSQEPQYHVALFGGPGDLDVAREAWLDASAEWLMRQA